MINLRYVTLNLAAALLTLPAIFVVLGLV